MPSPVNMWCRLALCSTLLVSVGRALPDTDPVTSPYNLGRLEYALARLFRSSNDPTEDLVRHLRNSGRWRVSEGSRPGTLEASLRFRNAAFTRCPDDPLSTSEYRTPGLGHFDYRHPRKPVISRLGVRIKILRSSVDGGQRSTRKAGALLIRPVWKLQWRKDRSWDMGQGILPTARYAESDLMIQCGRELIIEVYEAGPRGSRAATDSAIALIEKELLEVQRARSTESTAPSGVQRIRKKGESCIHIERGQDGLYHQVWGFANSGEPGVVELRVFEKESHSRFDLLGSPMHAPATRYREIIGYSSEPREQYFFGSAVQLNHSADIRGVPLQVDLRFFPAASSGVPKLPRRLLTRDVLVQTW